MNKNRQLTDSGCHTKNSKMFSVRCFIAGRMTAEMGEACDKVSVRREIISENVINRIKAVKEEILDLGDYDCIRYIFHGLEGVKHMRSHLSVMFQLRMYTISRVIAENRREGLPGGRRRLLSREQEDEILEYARDCQRAGRCLTLAQATHWVNFTLLEGQPPVSNSFISSNDYLLENLRAGVPQEVEALRVEASTFENFQNFFQRLEGCYSRHDYDPDMIINVDESTTHAGKVHRSTKVLYDPDLNIRPISSGETKEEHVTLCLGISASGKRLEPHFIVKNKNVTVEATLRNEYFDCGSYSLSYSPNGWQSKVRKRY